MGISEELSQLLENGEVDQAVDLLEEHDISHSKDKRTTYGGPKSSSDNQIGTQSLYNKNKSEVSLIGWHKYDNMYGVNLNCVMNWGHGSAVDEDGPSDAYAISFAGSRWEPEPGTFRGQNSPRIDMNPEGVIGKTNLAVSTTGPPYNNYGSFRGTIEKRDDEDHNVYGHFGHTWSPFDLPSNVSFGIAYGALSVSVGGAGDSWVMPAPTIEI